MYALNVFDGERAKVALEDKEKEVGEIRRASLAAMADRPAETKTLIAFDLPADLAPEEVEKWLGPWLGY